MAAGAGRDEGVRGTAASGRGVQTEGPQAVRAGPLRSPPGRRRLYVDGQRQQSRPGSAGRREDATWAAVVAGRPPSRELRFLPTLGEQRAQGNPAPTTLAAQKSTNWK